jgi:predicted Fe-Mo cluster-binding NifX family protein
VWEGKVSPVFDTASCLRVFQLEDQKEKSRSEIDLHEQDLSRKCVRIKGLGVDLLICGAITEKLLQMLIASGVRVIPWVSGAAEEVLEAYIKGRLYHPRFLMPGCEWRTGKSREYGDQKPGGRSDRH